MITEILIYLSDLFTERNRQKQLTGKSTQLHTVTPSWRASPPCSPLGQETQMRQSTPPLDTVENSTSGPEKPFKDIST